jgi:integrase
MESDHFPVAPQSSRRSPWNKGKLIGAKPPLRPSHVWSIRTKLQMADRKRDLALFNLALDSKLRGCDVVALRVDDIAPSGYATDRATIRQRKTGRPVRFELTDQTRLAVDEYLRLTGRKSGQYHLRVEARPPDLQQGSTPGSFMSGWRASGSIQPSSAHTRCGERRQC